MTAEKKCLGRLQFMKYSSILPLLPKCVRSHPLAFALLDLNPHAMKWFVLLLVIIKGDAYIRFGKKAQEKYGLQSYMVLIFISDKPRGYSRKVCGGTLLTNQVVLTACHCLHDAKDNRLNFGGEVQLYAYENFYEGEVDTSKPRHQQEKYTFKSYYIPGSECVSAGLNPDVDYALLFLDKPLGFAELGNDTICTTEHSPVIPMLARFHKVDYKEILTKDPCFLAGFGLEEIPESPTGIKQLKYTWVETVKYVENYTLDVTFQMNGDKRSGACRGDSGAPLICIHNHMPFVMGVVSGGQTTNYTLQAQIAKMNPELAQIYRRKFKGKRNKTGSIRYWQKLCAQYYQDWGYVDRKYRRKEEDVIKEDCPLCSAVQRLSRVVLILSIFNNLF